MKLGLYLRNMGPQSEPGMLLECARAAEASQIDDVWVADHIAIPPDQSEGSNGRYLDPLATLAYLAGVTSRVGLGIGVLVVPYRAALATAKWVATIQELSRGRLLLGVGIGWMDAEFKAVGVPRTKRGAVTDATLDFLDRCFADDLMESNGQPFLFLPRPPRPQIFIGGTFPHALRRAVRLRAGWMPVTGAKPNALGELIKELSDAAAAAGQPAPEVVVPTALAIDDPPRAIEQVRAYAEAGVTRLVHGWRYGDASEFARAAEVLGTRVRAAL